MSLSFALGYHLRMCCLFTSETRTRPVPVFMTRNYGKTERSEITFRSPSADK